MRGEFVPLVLGFLQKSPSGLHQRCFFAGFFWAHAFGFAFVEICKHP